MAEALNNSHPHHHRNCVPDDVYKFIDIPQLKIPEILEDSNHKKRVAKHQSGKYISDNEAIRPIQTLLETNPRSMIRAYEIVPLEAYKNYHCPIKFAIDQIIDFNENEYFGLKCLLSDIISAFRSPTIAELLQRLDRVFLPYHRIDTLYTTELATNYPSHPVIIPKPLNYIEIDQINRPMNVRASLLILLKLPITFSTFMGPKVGTLQVIAVNYNPDTPTYKLCTISQFSNMEILLHTESFLKLGDTLDFHIRKF